MIHLHKQSYAYLEEVNRGIIKHLPRNTSDEVLTVLDVGCGPGVLAEEVSKRGYQVWGIENNPGACQRAERHTQKIISEDLTNLAAIREAIGEQTFDYLVFADVLEHLYDPFWILREYLGFLKPGGRVLISLPNVLAWPNRLRMFFGFFEYADTGTMDRTHIRFFTFRSAKELLLATGCRVMKVDYTPYFVRALLPLLKKILLKGKRIEDTQRNLLKDSPFYKIYLKFIYPVEYVLGYWRKPLFGYGIILVGEKQTRS